MKKAVHCQGSRSAKMEALEVVDVSKVVRVFIRVAHGE